MEVLPSSGVVENDLLIHPKLKCDFPCKNCVGPNDNERDFCTKCYTPDDGESFVFLMPELGICQAGCSDGFSSDGKEDKVCEQCATGCKTCAIIPLNP